MQAPGMYEFGSGPGSQKLTSGRIISDGSDMISGKWINRANGNIINVRGSMTDDSGNMILMTDRGPLNMEEFSRLYVQASDEIYDSAGKVIDSKPIEVNDVKFSNDETPLVADDIFTSTNNTSNTPKLKNFDLIDKIFKKIESRPIADLKIDWADFPEKELSMLVNYFDVELDEISTYIGKYLINEDLLKNALSEFLKKHLK